VGENGKGYEGPTWRISKIKKKDTRLGWKIESKKSRRGHRRQAWTSFPGPLVEKFWSFMEEVEGKGLLRCR